MNTWPGTFSGLSFVCPLASYQPLYVGWGIFSCRRDATRHKIACLFLFPATSTISRIYERNNSHYFILGFFSNQIQGILSERLYVLIWIPQINVVIDGIVHICC